MLPLDLIRKWLCYFVMYGHGKLDLRFVHGRAKMCIGKGAVEIAEENNRTTSFREKSFAYLQTHLLV